MSKISIVKPVTVCCGLNIKKKKKATTKLKNKIKKQKKA